RAAAPASSHGLRHGGRARAPSQIRATDRRAATGQAKPDGKTAGGPKAKHTPAYESARTWSDHVAVRTANRPKVRQAAPRDRYQGTRRYFGQSDRFRHGAEGWLGKSKGP